MAVTCVASLLPARIPKVGNKGLDDLGSLQLAVSGIAAQRTHKNWGIGVCRAAQSSSQRHVIITGGNTGIGKATAIDLAKLGMSVTIACRNMEKGEQAVADIIHESKSSSVRVLQLDLASFASIREFAAEYLDSGLSLNCLVNNAGTKSRVVVLASAAERIGNIDFEDLNYRTRNYNGWQAYGQSKLANCLFSHELARRCKSLGIPVTSNSMHPNAVDTGLSFGKFCERWQMMKVWNS